MKKSFKDALWLTIPICICIIIEDSLINISNIIMAKIMGEFTNNILYRNSEELIYSIYNLLVISIVILVIIPLISLLTNSLMIKNALKHEFIVLNNFYRKIYLKVLQSSDGELLSRLETDPLNIRYSIIEIFTEPIVVIITTYTLLSNMFSISFQYGLVCIIVSIGTLLIPIIIKKMELRYNLEVKDINDTEMKLERELIENHTYLKFTNMHNIFIENYSKFFNENYKKIHKKYSKNMLICNFIKEFYKKISILFIIFCGIVLTKQNKIELGNIITFISYLYTTQYVIDKIGNLFKIRLMLKQNIERLDFFYENQEPIKQKIINESIKKIEFKNLVLNFNNNNNLINYKIYKNDKIFISGLNGKGKSTLLKCLIGLYDNYEGDILINDVNLKEIDLDWWRSKINYLPQTPFLFKDSIKNNILFNTNAPFEELENILNLLNINLDLEKIVIKGGTNLSGGEKQKISIARALIKKCEIIILDEPFNNLDSITKENIYNFLKNIDITIIFISHDKNLQKLSNKTLEI